MNLANRFIVLALLLAMLTGAVLAQDTIMKDLGTKAANEAMTELQFEKGDANILALTNAGHAIVDGKTTQGALKGLTEESGNSVATATSSRFCGPTGSHSGSTSITRRPAKRFTWRPIATL